MVALLSFFPLSCTSNDQYTVYCGGKLFCQLRQRRKVRFLAFFMPNQAASWLFQPSDRRRRRRRGRTRRGNICTFPRRWPCNSSNFNPPSDSSAACLFSPPCKVHVRPSRAAFRRADKNTSHSADPDDLTLSAQTTPCDPPPPTPPILVKHTCQSRFHSLPPSFSLSLSIQELHKAKPGSKNLLMAKMARRF